MKRNLLFVDDEQACRDALQRTVHRTEREWELTCVSNPVTAWERLLDAAYDAVITDINMPGISGLDLLKRIRRTDSTRDIPVVVLTGMFDHRLKQRALELGASDLFNKPVDSGQLIARLQSMLAIKDRQDDMTSTLESLRRQVDRHRDEVVRARLDGICHLANAAEYRDSETGNHVIRVGSFSHAVAKALGWDEMRAETLLLAAPLHDIGKIGIPDSILLKPGPLSPAERAVMQRHCVIGQRILREPSKAMAPLLDCYSACSVGGMPANPLLEMAASVALTHHEHWNGRGYPSALAGTQIPLESRIVAVCDVFDALMSWRPYKPARSEADALTTLHEESGSHFDPEVYSAFIRALPEIRSIRQRLADGAASGAD